MSEPLLQLLLANSDTYISGEEISRQLHISRTAVWKQINKLRSKGYEFDAIPRVGYRLKQKPERLELTALLSGLRSTVMGKQIKILDSTPSTQIVAQELAEQGAPEGTLVIAEEQTSGRGRMGRPFYSPSGKGIWMSLVLKPQTSLQFTPQLTLLAAVALCRSLQRVVPISIGIKWPNDLLVGTRKICGILLESSTEDERVRYAIAGIGISANLDVEDYPEYLKDIATSLKIESGAKVDRTAIITEFLAEFETLYQLYHEQGFAPIRILWEALSISLHRPITIHTLQGKVTGIAEELDDSGALWITDEFGEKRKIFSGDVEINR
ncbi:biotin--[acetyl-CoA-carboxylase] ligase [Paenibacillus selenitireducens]|uniref:Bifunctional ligase/repressor BirA n=1 Tax=Paenibacillus selenitireducens TaxID=1324314 RepID=A0A1T2XNL9_9BACL|nr:biotin--[acetyl-CoA-carboxylase] ligase [Paenibacillus selenitireducens]OPA81474.1 biotin--[acetyl-CoA-carboxylase] ligase [Paenibacillus selenitireducens]